MIAVSADRPATRLSTRLAFLATGFALSCWAPLVPFAKARLGVDEGQLGLLLLCLGFGSILAMPVTGMLCARLGARPMILLGGVGAGLLLPALAFANSTAALGAALLGFGASIGTLDVAINAHAVEVEAASKRPLMSGFHAQFSIGGFVGAGGMTLLLSLGIAPLASALCGGLLTLAIIGGASPGLLRIKPAGGGAAFAFPKGIVLLIAGLTAVTFLTEGAILDWSALLITSKNIVPASQGGVGYMLFSMAMTVGRLLGDAIVARLGPRRMLIVGGLIAVIGFVVLLAVPLRPIAMAGFLLIGLGAANLVPVLFSAAGRQRTMPPALAIAAITTTGYAGILAGPAAVGFVAQAVGLTASFWMLAALMCLVPLLARPAAR
jgi:predicted MFS family arabinose efflux permease